MVYIFLWNIQFHFEIYIQLILFEWTPLFQVIHIVLNEFLVLGDAGTAASHCGGSVDMGEGQGVSSCVSV